MNPILAIVLIAVVGLFVWLFRATGWRVAGTRTVQAVLVIIFVTFATTWLLRQFPGDPCLVALGTSSTEESVAQCVDDQGLDENVIVQYREWAGTILSGDLGYAQYRNRLPLSDVISTRMPRTLALFVYSQAIALAIAVPMGVWSAYQAGRTPRARPPRWALPAAVVLIGLVGVVGGWPIVILAVFAAIVPAYVYHGFRGGAPADKLVSIQAFVLLSVPVFVLGEALRYWFAIRWSWYDLNGYVGPTSGIVEHAKSIWLPALVLGLAVSPVYLRLLRADMIQNLQEDFVAVAKAKGMPTWWVLVRHVLRPSSLTLLTVAGVNIAQLVNGAIVVEFIYDLDGMGSFLITSVVSREFFAVQTVVALVAVIFVLANLLIDLIYSSVDPRVKIGTER